MLEKLTRISIKYPWMTIIVILLVTGVFLLQFPKITIDTDPENMLQKDQVDRAYYDKIKEEFDIDDIIVVGIVDENNIFRPEALRTVNSIINAIKKIELTYTYENEEGETVTDPAINVDDIVSISTTKNLFSKGDSIDPRFIMPEDFFDEPETPQEFKRQVEELRPYLDSSNLPNPTTFEELLSVKADKMHSEIKDTPFLNERVASAEGDAVAIYVPITHKKIGYPVALEIERIMDEQLLGGQEYHVAGLPIAEETFGHEMFIQMAVVAPAAFILIMLIVYLLFRQPMFLIPVGITAALSVTWAMGLLIGLDFTVHIMSSMIPVFLLPIAILNSVHILSQFFDRFCETGKREESLMWAMRRLYVPMFFTSLTSAVGFASLALADIPPVQVFGLFVSFGIGVAWFFSLTLVPAMVNLLDEHKLACRLHKLEEEKKSFLDKILQPIRSLTFKRAPYVITAAVVLLVLGIAGIMMIQVNDNPVKWFKEGHPIRVADQVLNEKFGGTYMTNIILEGQMPPADDEEYQNMLETGEFPNMLNNPEVARYISKMQHYLEEHETVGKVSSTYDAAKRVRYVFVGGNKQDMARKDLFERYYSIATADDIDINEDIKYALFEKLVLDHMSDDEYDEFLDKYEYPEDSPLYEQFEITPEMKQAYLSRSAFNFINWSIGQLDNDKNTQRDLTKFLVRDQRIVETQNGDNIENIWKKANIWIQLKSGDNQSMQQVENKLENFIADNPPPAGLKITWTGLTYINKVWQDLMVSGMLFAIIGSFAIVFLLMLMEFRSVILGVLAMVPLTLALILSYGLMGWIGKDYDMPIAVCSSLSLGLAVDFAIHFLQRYKNHYKQTKDAMETHNHMFEEPGRAIMRNAIVISLGFLPLMISSLTPYVTVGSFFSLLMVMATLATMFVLPAAMRYLTPIVLKKYAQQGA
jgi:predicted RND superfamily exporter protein